MLSDELDSDNPPESTSPLMEFDLPLPDLSARTPGQDLSAHHTELSKLLGLPEDLSNLNHIFGIIASLCDVYTQPEENDDIVLSIDYIADLVIALAYSNLRTSLNTNPLAPEEVKNPEIQSLKFDMALAFFTILETVLTGLNCESSTTIESVDNSEKYFPESLEQWTPYNLYGRGPLYYNLCYRITCVLLYILYKLYIPEDGSLYNLALNPFLFFIVKTWKIHTAIIIFGLEIDRRLEEKGIVEEDGSTGTPDIVLETLKGSSAIRYVCAWILNQNSSLNSVDKEIVRRELRETEHDLKEISLLLFMHPLGRKKIDGGALTVDIRLITAALLTVNTERGHPFAPNVPTETLREGEIDETSSLDYAKDNEYRHRTAGDVGNLIFDLEYLDRYDEDIRYIFLLGAEMEDEDEGDFDYDEDYGLEYEYVDENGEKLSQKEIEEFIKQSKLHNEPKIIEQIEDSKFSVNTEPHKQLNKGENGNQTINTSAVRSTRDPEAIEFDEHGRDWRDIPRGENVEVLNHVWEAIGDNYCTKWEDFVRAFSFVATTPDSKLPEFVKMADLVHNTVIKSIIDDEKGIKQAVTPDLIEMHMVSAASKEDLQSAKDKNWIIDHQMDEITNWELLFLNEAVLATSVFDEMLMCKGYRRILIWYLARVVSLSPGSINYMFELAKGIRGTTMLFSRKGGGVILSDVEKLMLIDEFISNALVVLAQKIRHGAYSNPVAIKIAMLVCLTIGSLIGAKIIDVHAGKPGHEDLYDFSQNLQMFLISWIGILPSARKLYFLIKNAKANQGDADMDSGEIREGDEDEREQEVEVEKYLDGLSNSTKHKELLNDLKDMEPWDSSAYFGLNPEKLLIVNNFTNSIEKDLKWINCVNRKEEEYVENKLGAKPTNLELQETLQLFLNNFNTWSKMEFFAQEIFVDLENLAKFGLVVEEEEEEEDDDDEEEEEGEEYSDVENEVEEGDSNGQLLKRKSKKAKLGKSDTENEFNDEFLDGLGEFRDDNKKSAKKKKKKKKKGKKK